MIEYTDVEVRAAQLAKMVGIEDLVWMQIEGYDKIWSVADEDLERSTEAKTSAVHFLRFEVSDDMADALKNGAKWTIGVQHPVYTYEVVIEDNYRDNLIRDLL